MFCYTDRVVTKSGDALPGYFVRVLERATGAVVPIFADENGTPIVTVSGLANAAKTDDLGNFSLFVADGVYSVERLDPAGVRVPPLVPYVNLGGVGATGPQGPTGPIGSAAQQGSLAPMFIDTLASGMLYTVPANLRTGLSSATYPNGTGYLEELKIAVTGTAGSKVLTTAETTKVAGLGSNPFDGALNSTDRTDGGDDFFVKVRTHNGSTTITLDQPLERAFTGTLGPKHSDPTGQHLSFAGTRAYSQLGARATGCTSSRGAVLAGDWADRPTVNDAGAIWQRNAALTSYGVSNDGTFNVVSQRELLGAANMIASGGLVPFRASALAGTGLQFGTHLVGHGATATVQLGRKSMVLDFCTGAFRPTSPDLTSVNVSMTVEVKVDGTTIYKKTGVTDWLMQHVVVTGVGDTAVIDITNQDGGKYYIVPTELTIREAGEAGKMIGKKAVALGDSWFEWYDGEFGKAFAAKTGMSVTTKALGGQTTVWGLDYFDKYVRDEKPDLLLCSFFTNDSNRLGDQTFTAADGSTKAKWPYNAAGDPTLALTRALWAANINALAGKAQAIGCRPAFMLPTGTASLGQAQEHATLRLFADRGRPAANYNATATEAANAAAFVNTRGKMTGNTLLIAGQPVAAAGPTAAAAWTDPAGITGLNAFKKAARLGDYVIPAGFTIGTDTTPADGLTDGLAQVVYSTTTGDTYTPTIVGGAQRYASSFAASGAAGNSRLRFGWDFTSYAGRTVFLMLNIANATSNLAVDALSTVGSGGAAFGAANGPYPINTITGTSGSFYGREVALTGTKFVFINALRSNGNSRTLDITTCRMIDLTTLLVDAPILATYTDAQLFAFLSGMTL